jgi:hypothetical protein
LKLCFDIIKRRSSLLGKANDRGHWYAAGLVGT